MKTLLLSGAMALVSSLAFAQAPVSTSTSSARPNVPAAGASLATPMGHEVNVSVGSYDYVEPGDLRISIHGPTFGGEYVGRLSVNQHRRLFVEADARGMTGQVTYDGWCSPWLISPNAASPNGYELNLGDAWVSVTCRTARPAPRDTGPTSISTCRSA